MHGNWNNLHMNKNEGRGSDIPRRIRIIKSIYRQNVLLQLHSQRYKLIKQLVFMIERDIDGKKWY